MSTTNSTTKSATITTVGGIKGGPGKTTTAINCVLYHALKGADVLLVDADEQETSTQFTRMRDHTLNGAVGYTAIKLTGANVRTQVLNLRDKFQHIIIDTGGRDTQSQRAALSISDVYIVPFQPRNPDFWTLPDVIELINDTRAIKTTEIKAYSFLNRADVRSEDNRDTAAALSEVPEIDFIDAPWTNRKSFANAMGKGLSVLELSDDKAQAEVNKLFDRIYANF